MSNQASEATTTSNTGNSEHPWHGWADPKDKEHIKNMLDNMSKEEILKWLLKKNRQKPS